MNRINLVPFSLQNRIFGPYLADISKIINSVTMPDGQCRTPRTAARPVYLRQLQAVTIRDRGRTIHRGAPVPGCQGTTGGGRWRW
jgi:hypothetical protein